MDGGMCLPVVGMCTMCDITGSSAQTAALLLKITGMRVMLMNCAYYLLSQRKE